MSKKKILIIGGSGFLGTALLKNLLAYKDDFDVGATSRKSMPPNFRKVRFHQMDILNLEEVLTSCKGYDIVVNCTGQVSHPISSCLLQNTVGIANIIRAKQKHNFKLVQISSTSVYGKAKKATENSTLNPDSAYSAIKAGAEFFIQSSMPENDYLILRISNLYGSMKSYGVISYLLAHLEDKSIAFENQGDLMRVFLHAEDAADIISRIVRNIQKCKGIYNIPGNEQYTINQLLELIEELTHRTIIAKFKNLPATGIVNYISAQKICKIIALEYSHNIRDYLMTIDSIRRLAGIGYPIDKTQNN